MPSYVSCRKAPTCDHQTQQKIELAISDPYQVSDVKTRVQTHVEYGAASQEHNWPSDGRNDQRRETARQPKCRSGEPNERDDSRTGTGRAK